MATIIAPENDAPATAVSDSAVSWPAALAGALVAIATSVILLALGSGLGFAAASPWPGAGPSLTTFAVGTGIWLIVMQWLSSALCGYITGRLRTRWTGIHTREVLFRDTAHGLLAWAVATAIVAVVALSATATTLNATASAANAVGYASDVLLRSDHLTTPALRQEVNRILTHEVPMSSNDRAYLGRLVAKETGLSVPEAQQRIDAATSSIRNAADQARKVSSAVGFFTALSMLIGAFIASAAAAYAGHLRDERD